MSVFLISPKSLPAEGKQFILDDQDIWLDPIREFGMDCLLSVPLQAEFILYPQEEGVLVKGKLTGEVIVPCNRCMEPARVAFSQRIETFEAYPEPPVPIRGRVRQQEEPDAGLDREVDSAVMRFATDGHSVEMDVAALAWQEFSLALPIKPLCDTRCKGLCPKCGASKNVQDCACVMDEEDPRFAVLRHVKIPQ